MKLIPKDALVAKIENWKQHTLKCGYAGQGEYEEGNKQGRLDTCKKILSFLDTLEVKEVDLDDYNKVKKVLSLSFMQFLDSHCQEGKMCLSNGECFDIDKAFDELDFAKLFRYMEKYLKAQKGE